MAKKTAAPRPPQSIAAPKPPRQPRKRAAKPKPQEPTVPARVFDELNDLTTLFRRDATDFRAALVALAVDGLMEGMRTGGILPRLAAARAKNRDLFEQYVDRGIEGALREPPKVPGLREVWGRLRGAIRGEFRAQIELEVDRLVALMVRQSAERMIGAPLNLGPVREDGTIGEERPTPAPVPQRAATEALACSPAPAWLHNILDRIKSGGAECQQGEMVGPVVVSGTITGTPEQVAEQFDAFLKSLPEGVAVAAKCDKVSTNRQ